MSQPDRLENLEVVVRALRAEVAELRAELQRQGGAADAAGAAGAASAPPAREARAAEPVAAASSARPPEGAPPRSHDGAAAAGAYHPFHAARTTVPPAGDAGPGDAGPSDAGDAAGQRTRPRAAAAPGGASPGIESLVGRYGTLGLGALALVMALGAWLSWAIENYEMSDAARVAGGAVGAVAVGALGLWLRRRGTTRYGNVLLGIALALVHVDAWGAGPTLHVVPMGVALGVAALASAALAVLAYRNNEESLFVVGVGGALAAPFVTSDGRGRILLLLLYGWLVLGGAIYALRGRGWKWAQWLVAGGTLAYAVTGAVNDPPGGTPWYVRDAALFFALNVAAAAWAGEPGAARRGVLARRLLYVALVPAFIYYGVPATAVDRVALVFAATVLGYLALRGVEGDARARVDRFALPLLYLGAGLVSVFSDHAPPSLVGAGVALLWAGAATASATLARVGEPERGIDLAVAGLASAAAIPVALGGQHALAPVGVALHAALFALLVRRERQLIVAVPVAFGLAVASAWSFELLAARPHYGYTPFATTASLAAGACALAACVTSWIFTRRDLRAALGIGGPPGVVVGAVGPALAFLWGNNELAYAVSPAVASFALIAYWATAGVLAIFVGRGRAIPAARQVGLALAIIAALKAVGQASDEQSIGLRIGSYLLVGVFLLAVAYWYRATGSAEAAPDGTRLA